MFSFDRCLYPDERLSELERFIVFWMGPRSSDYGKEAAKLERIELPTPLHRLYSFAGHWPAASNADSFAFEYQDALRKVDRLALASDGKLVFADENQGVWVCATESSGDDPPVWVAEGYWDADPPSWQLVTDSLSQFLVSFCLQEMLYTSRMCISDTGLR